MENNDVIVEYSADNIPNDNIDLMSTGMECVVDNNDKKKNKTIIDSI